MSWASRTNVIRICVIVAVVAAILVFVVRGPIERAMVLQAVRATSGFESLDAQRVEARDDGYELFDVRVAMADGALRLSAPQASVSGHANAYAVMLMSPVVRFDPAAYRDADRARVRDAFARNGATSRATIVIKDGVLEIGPLAEDARLRADRIAGTLDVRTARATFAGTLALEAAGVSYPIAGSASGGDDDAGQAWSAAALPLAPFAAMLDTGTPARPVSGFLRDVHILDAPHFSASARVDDATIALGDHALHGLHGDLIAAGDGIGTHALEGYLDAAPFRAIGEIHDLRSHYRWLESGTSDLRGLAKLADEIAAEPALRGPVELETIAPGLVLGQYHLLGDHGPLAISILSADPHEKTLRFDTAIANDHVISGGERTSVMGVRTRAVAGVNGDYFDIGRTYQPQGMLVRSSALVRGPTDRAVLAIDRNNHVTFGEFHMMGRLDTARGSVRVSEFNDWPPGYVSIITPNYGGDLAPAHATFVALLPLGGTKYRVRRVVPGIDRIPVDFGVAIGPLARIPVPAVGDVVRLSYATDPPLRDAVAAIGGGPILVKDSLPYEDPHAPAPDERNYRWPVVALAQTTDARLDLVAVDGRHPERSVGMTRPEFTELLERFGAQDAMALDSGGSVTLVARTPGDSNVSVRNVPSDNSDERWVSDALFVYSSAPLPSIVLPASVATPVPEVRPSP